ncbi:MAG: hypothetical protein SO373_03490 [Candidatus Borkfalkiaceae bacterium]|nr:hypothetical protein [Christensenellaceae bacterium]
MNISDFLGTFEGNQNDITMNLFLEGRFELAPVYTFLSELYNRGVIKEKEEKGHFELCSDMESVNAVINELSVDDSDFVDNFAEGKIEFTIRLENTIHNGFEVKVKSSSTPLEILRDALLDTEKTETQCLFVDPFQCLSYDEESEIDKAHSAFILQFGENRIRFNFDEPLSASGVLGKLYYDGVIPDFIVSIVCEH